MPVYDVVESRVLWQSRWYALRQDRLRAADGREFDYTIVQHPGSVVVVPVTHDGHVVLIRQYRHPVGDYCLEIPAGGLADSSTFDEAARRELLEEVGGCADALQPVGWFYTSNGISNEVAHVFLATGVVLGRARCEPTEMIDVHQVPVAEALRMAHHGEITDGRSALALLLCEHLLT